MFYHWSQLTDHTLYYPEDNSKETGERTSEVRATLAIGLLYYSVEICIDCLRKILKFISLNGHPNILSSTPTAMSSESQELTREILYRDKAQTYL
jgi:hypothetical protein